MMNIAKFRTVIVAVLICLILAIVGCEERKESDPTEKDPKISAAVLESGATVGSLVQVISPDFIPVKGFALIGELNGMGSSECPPEIREYLTKYIRRHLPATDVDEMINSLNTAVVIVEGLLPASPQKGERFDLKVTAPGDTQTRSLWNGQLYGTELKAMGTFSAVSKTLALGNGPVYVDKTEPKSDEKVGYILAGGATVDEYRILLVIREPDYLIANKIRNKVIERFGEGYARAMSPSQVEIKAPAQYADQKNRFIEIVKATSLASDSQQIASMINSGAAALAGSGDKAQAELTLEAIGNEASKSLVSLLGSADLEVRFRSARCLLNIGNDKGFEVLRKIAFQKDNPYQIDAINAIAVSAKRSDAASLLRRLLRYPDNGVCFQAYDHLRKFNDIAVDREMVGGNFLLEKMAIANKKTIYIARSLYPRIALFGGAIECEKDVFIQSWNGEITINALPDQDYVNIIRKVPNRPTVPPITLKTSRNLADIIRVLGNEPKRRKQGDPIGLGVSYAQITALVDQMVKKGMVKAELHIGPLPQIGLK